MIYLLYQAGIIIYISLMSNPKDDVNHSFGIPNDKDNHFYQHMDI